jgi:putative ABC transport system permease protein
MTDGPPRLAAWLLHRLLDGASREEIAGDLEEEYHRLYLCRGPGTARRWYWAHVLRSLATCRITGRRRRDVPATDFDRFPGATLADLLRLSFRQFRHYPLYSFTCAATLALAVACACASFGVVRRALIDPLPYAQDEHLVSILTLIDGRTSAVSPDVLQDLRAAHPAITGFAPVRPARVAYTGAGGAEVRQANLVTSDYFHVLGVQPASGRTWRANERDVVVVSARFWRQALRADPAVIGTSITIDGTARTVVGVMAPAFVAPYWADADVWAPLDLAALPGDPRARRTLTIIARRRAGTSQADVDAFMSRFSSRLRQSHPDIHHGHAWIALPLRTEMIGASRPALIGIGAAALLLLAIVGANIAGLSSAQALATRHQAAIRAALGATRRRLVCQGAVDSAVLAGVGSAAGGWLAHMLVAWFAQHQEQFLPRLAPIALDAGTALVGCAAGLITGVSAGLLPSMIVHRWPPGASLHSRGGTAGVRVMAARNVLVAAQVSIAVILLVGAGLLVQSVHHLSGLPLGFSSAHLATFTVNLPGPAYQTPAAQMRFERAVLDRLAQARGVTAASASVGFPIVGGSSAGVVLRSRPDDGGLGEVAYFAVSPEFMGTTGARLVAGRDLSPADRADTPPVVLINETMARAIVPGGSALGAQLQIGPATPDGAWLTVVGIVADLRQHGPTERILPTAFASTAQVSRAARYFTVRTDGERPGSLATDLRAAVHATDPAIAVGAITPVDHLVSERTARHRVVMLALVLVAAVAVVLCVTGLYAVVALASRMRRREYAIRLALGAAQRSVRWLVVRQVLAVVGGGALAGMLAAAAGMRSMASFLHGVAPLDPATFAAAAGVLLALAGLATWRPAQRAERLNPADVLKEE